MTATDTKTLTRINHAGFTAYADVIVYDQYEHNIVFLSMFGNKSNMKAVSAALVSKIAVKIFKTESDAWGKYMTLSRDHTFNSMIKHVDPVSSLEHIIFYPTSAAYNYINPDMKIVIFLFREGQSREEIERAFYLYLDKALSIPIHRTWTGDLIEAMTREGLITELPGQGITAWRVDTWQDKIIQLISERIKEGRFNVN